MSLALRLCALLAAASGAAACYAPGWASLAIAPPPVGPAKRVTDRKPNLGGVVPILMYHRLGDKESYMVRSRKNFRRDLARLYKLGFRPVTMSEYVENRMALPPGASPVVLTFDDSWADQISLRKDGSVDPNTFVGIWMDFAKTRPAFPVKGTFYAIANGPFGQKGLGKKKIALLQKLGSEIGAHTLRHPSLGSVSRSRAMKEIGGSVSYLRKLGADVRTFAPPYGVWPNDRSLLDKDGFVFNGSKVSFNSVVSVGSGPAPAPASKRFRPMRLPRIVAYEGRLGVHDWLDQIQKGRTAVYVQP